MALSGTVPAARRFGWDPLPAARRIRLFCWAFAAVSLLVLFTCFGTQRVPVGMDTVPTIPARSLCIVDKRRSAVMPGCHVFVDLPGGGTVLSRVIAVDDATVTVQHPNAASALPDSRKVGPLPRGAVRSTVLVTFVPEDPPGVPVDGK